MRKVIFSLFLTLFISAGCTPVISTVVPQQPASTEPEINQQQAQRAELAREVWFRLDSASNFMVAHTHTLNRAAIESGLDTETSWQSAVWRWSSGVESWMRGVDRVRRAYSGRERVQALLALENGLLELEENLRNLRTVYAGFGRESESINEALERLGTFVTQARDAVFLANTRFINLTEE